MSTSENLGHTKKYSTTDKQFWRIIGALVSASLITFANLYFVQPLMPVFVKEYGISAAESSLSLSLSVISLMAGLLVFGVLSDRHGRRKTMDIGLALSILPLVLMPFIDSFQWLLALRIIQGFFIACVPAAAIAYISEEVSSKSVGLGIMLYIASNSLGGMFGRVGIGYVSDAISWKAALLALLVIEALLFVLYLLWIIPSRHFTPSSRPFKEDISGMLAHFRNGALVPLFLAGIIMQAAFTGIWTYLPFHLQQPPFGWSLAIISFTYFAYAGGVIGSITAGKQSESVPKIKLLSVGILLFIIGSMLTLLESGIWLVIGLCILCFGFFSAHALMTAIVNERATHHKGGASSLYLFSYYFGVAIGGTLTAFIWEGFGWMGVVILSVAALPLLIWIRISDKKPAAD